MPRIVRHLLVILALCLAGSPQVGFARGDADLYRTVAAKVRKGENYYAAVSEIYPQRHYPTRPFYTVRTPVLAYLLAALGEKGLAALASLLTLVLSGLWVRKLREHPVAIRALAAWIVLAVSLPLAFSPYLVIHDYWGGLLISLALAAPGPRSRAALGFAAAAVRELTVPFLGILALVERERRFACVGLAAAAVLFAVHASLIVPGGDMSAGWLGLRGPRGVIDDLVTVTGLQLIPYPVAVTLCVSPVVGWLGDRRALLWFAFFWVLAAVAARADNSYWVLNILPAWFVGIAIIPSALSRWQSRLNRFGGRKLNA